MVKIVSKTTTLISDINISDNNFNLALELSAAKNNLYKDGKFVRSVCLYPPIIWNLGRVYLDSLNGKFSEEESREKTLMLGNYWFGHDLFDNLLNDFLDLLIHQNFEDYEQFLADSNTLS